MEIVNQNSVNAEQERLNELKKEKQENIAILEQIQKEREALRQERGSFETYKQEQLDQIAQDRLTLKQEAKNAENIKRAEQGLAPIK